ncbi:DDB1- and CUL4-associated factor 12-like [Lytechinus variegatus]|uniref:DDB1- and CUL4-associated factor 12-like n=1 Tax=Lytechinus variegatus TaxID=7654 RepID=UPI001BB12A7D|nr:DDB1- and CUL4-associated factor 12-like [Lytechinus variegatus]XP_041465206.1 DDB1- and CUL4-associated factor 12-like [Lytechinus variegatus]
MQSNEDAASSRKSAAAALTERHRGEWMGAGDPESASVFHHIRSRTIGHAKHRRKVICNLTTRRLPHVLSEREIPVGEINKIFASEWISDHQVVVGTKCNRLMALDLNLNHQVSIPMLRSLPSKKPETLPMNNSGIHSISINPSGTLLATGADNPNNIGVYRLPTFDPVCVGQNCHKDWMFSVVWLDDQYLVAGSRDSQLSVWSVSQELCDRVQDTNEIATVPSYESIFPIALRSSERNEKVRALEYSPQTKELASLSANGFIHLWDLRGFRKVHSRRLPYCEENVCIALSQDHSLYAVGSQSHVTFLDSRNGRCVASVHSKERGSGVRSVSFKDGVLTVGTGQGALMFFELRAGHFIEKDVDGRTMPVKLYTGKGYLHRDSLFHQFFSESSHPNAVYTHRYDKSGTRLFVAGGPLPSGLSGNYAGLWH